MSAANKKNDPLENLSARDVQKLQEELRATELNNGQSAAKAKELREKLGRHAFAYDPGASNLVSQIAEAQAYGDRSRFVSLCRSGLLYGLKAIRKDTRPLKERAKSHGEPESIPMPEIWGFKKMGIPKAYPTYIIAAPGVGKTTLCLNLMLAFAEDEVDPLLMSIEMSDKQVANRLVSIHLCGQADLSFGLEEMDKLIDQPAQQEILEQIEQRIHIESFQDHEKVTAEDVILYTEHYIEKRGGKPPGVIVIDYLQLLAHEADDDKKGMDDAISKLVFYGRQKRIPIIIISQRKRGAKDNMEAAQGTSKVEQTAGLLFNVSRAVCYGKPHDILKIKCSKNKFGPTGTAYINVDKAAWALTTSATREEYRAAREANNREDKDEREKKQPESKELAQQNKAGPEQPELGV